MAKSRKQQGGLSERRERLLGTWGYAGGTTMELGGAASADFSEEDVWSTVIAEEDMSIRRSQSWVNMNRSQNRAWHDRSTVVGRHDGSTVVGGLSLAFDQHHSRPSVSGDGGIGSVPVNVPTWRRTEADYDDDERVVMAGEEEWVPPHEYLAREKGKRGAATSVLEGVGRTLKGRDMSRVRDAVWSQTGFFG